jgi:biopolymer transport protein ExbD
MAQIEGGGSGGRKAHFEVNLVPFIDLMSVLITFLLITAVWTQVSMIQIGSSIYGKKSGNQVVPLTPDVDKVVKVDVRRDGFFVTIGVETTLIPMKGPELDQEALLELLKKAKLLYPNKIDAMIAVEETLSYESLIVGMDMILKAGFPQISVAAGGP